VRRAAASIPSNFVEGFRKRTKPDKLRFYNIAQGSADECLYHLILAHDFCYADTSALQADLEEISRLLQGYINGLERDGC
jgi:four helix bundle protein